MKPITLTVAGLHSFREKQTIDFGSLCEGGVFGIFGPTGSGKSSILDAMTLALYGKVERASNNTHGILNHAEDKLHVSFTFELENAQGSKRYMIERSFKRQDELKVKSSVCRLIEVSEESVVLADKAREVDNHIEGLLGLTIEDFTRAVVLPQGKFAEFLSLKGADRRQMLQRLFNLEQYGDKLNKKLKMKLTATKNELGEVTAEQAGLGDASSEAIKAAEKELTDVEILLEKRRNELNNVEENYEKSKNVWEWQQEKISILTRIVEVEQDGKKIRLLEEQLKQAEAADRIIPYLEEYEASNEAVANWTTKYNTFQNLLVTKKEESESSAKKYHIKRQEKTEKLPIFVRKKHQLLEAKGIQEKINELEAETSRLKLQLEDLKTQLAEKQRLVGNISNTIAEEQEKQQKLKKQLTLKTVSALERDEVRKANEQKQIILHSQTTLSELEADLEKKRQQLKDAENLLAAKDEELLLGKKRMETLFFKNELTYKTVCERERASEKAILQAEYKLSEKKHELEVINRNNLAIQLAGQLKSGEACPVCGSTKHPSPVVALDDHGEQQLESEIEGLTSEITLAREIRQEYLNLKLKLEQISQGLIQEYPGQMEVYSKDSEEAEIESMEGFSKVKTLEIEQKSLQQDYLQLKETGRKVIQELRAIVQLITQLNQSVESNHHAYRETLERVTKLRENIQVQIKDWKQSFTKFEFGTVEEKLEEMSRNDQFVQELAVEIEKSTILIQQKEQEKKTFENESNNLERIMVDITSTLRNKNETLHELRERLAKEVGTQNIDQLLLETENTLKELEESEAKAYEAWQRIQMECQQLENETHGASQALKDSQIRLEKATSKWREILASTSFAQVSEVKAAIMPKQDLDLMKSKITAYWDGFKQLEAELIKVNDLLQGQELTHERWEEIKLMLEEMRAMFNETVEAKGAALKALQVLQDKHERYKILKARRIELETLAEQYSKLQSVFKGNSFVEYLAEEQLIQVSHDASERLGILTRNRYAIEVDSLGGFIMRDDANGGVRRPVTTLSGGETFLTSLALALSLSAQIQLRGEYPLQFFFLDEGFGTLDADLLDTVVSALEKLHSAQLAVGVISHVQELRARLPKRLIVDPAEHSGRGTVVRIETL
ncbi:SbcC/MukB-like Walker B domain-containing protein [Fredinandcohnia humi]